MLNVQFYIRVRCAVCLAALFLTACGRDGSRNTTADLSSADGLLTVVTDMTAMLDGSLPDGDITCGKPVCEGFGTPDMRVNAFIDCITPAAIPANQLTSFEIYGHHLAGDATCCEIVAIERMGSGPQPGAAVNGVPDNDNPCHLHVTIGAGVLQMPGPYKVVVSPSAGYLGSSNAVTLTMN